MRRFMLFLILTFVLFILITSLFAKGNKVYNSTYNGKYRKIKISNGDTIWNIAMNNKPQNYDIRKMVFEIIELNHMENAHIYPGDLIKVPIGVQ